MYYEHYGLDEPPFRITPDTRLFFEGGSRGPILDAMVYAINNGEGIIKVVGEVGSGKTMLCRMLEVRLPETVEVVYLANPSLSPENILHAIAFELKLPVAEDASRLQVMQALQHYLLERHGAGRQVVVFVEEAQSMPLETLEEIRLLSNLETQRHKLLQLVLFGQPELEPNLSAPHIRQLRERITHSFELPPFTRAEIKAYLAFRLAAAGYRGVEVFSDAAVSHIARASQGLIRRVNIIADKSLLAAFAQGRHRVTPREVRTAVRDSDFSGHRRRSAGNLALWVVFAASTGAAASAAVVALWPAHPPEPPPGDLAAGPMTEGPVPVRAGAAAHPAGLAQPVAPLAPPAPGSPSAAPPEAVAAPNGPAGPGEHPALPLERLSETLATAVDPPPRPGPAMATAPPTPDPLPAATPAPEPVATSLPSPGGEAGDADYFARRLAATRRWLADADPSHFTIQLMVISPARGEKLEDNLRRADLGERLDQVWVYHTVIRGTRLVSVLLGDYPRHDQAREALDGLAPAMQQARPFIRNVGDIRARLALAAGN